MLNYTVIVNNSGIKINKANDVSDFKLSVNVY